MIIEPLSVSRLSELLAAWWPCALVMALFAVAVLSVPIFWGAGDAG